MDAAYRHRGLGGKLLERAEAEALSMGIDRGYLETISLQARPFYEKQGYEVFVQLGDQPPGHTCYYLKSSVFGNARSKMLRTAFQAPLKGSELSRV